VTSPTDPDNQIHLEQYKLAVEMADRISSRRGTANVFYFTVSSALLGTTESFGLTIASVAGLALSCAWWLQLRSYRTLASAKWKVITDLETHLPTQPFAAEWALLKIEPVERIALKGRWRESVLQPLARYPELSLVEQVVPCVYLVLFIISIIWASH
jgi:hypothetical protein